MTVAFIEKVSAVLGVATDIVQPSNPLSAYGLDSIVAIEFRKWFMKSINVDVQIFDVLGSKSITDLVTKAATMIKFDADAEVDDSDSPAAGINDNAGADQEMIHKHSGYPKNSQRLTDLNTCQCPLSRRGCGSNITSRTTSHP